MSLSRCVPICSSCTNGVCTAPETCDCKNGYKWDASVSKCNPICQPSCAHGLCIEPNKCECFPGYELNSDKQYLYTYNISISDFSACFRCLPKCTNCQHGTCNAPDLCACHIGYTWENATTQCIPVCKLECKNGICVSPDNCDCLQGYEKNEESM